MPGGVASAGSSFPRPYFNRSFHLLSAFAILASLGFFEPAPLVELCSDTLINAFKSKVFQVVSLALPEVLSLFTGY